MATLGKVGNENSITMVNNWSGLQQIQQISTKNVQAVLVSMSLMRRKSKFRKSGIGIYANGVNNIVAEEKLAASNNLSIIACTWRQQVQATDIEDDYWQMVLRRLVLVRNLIPLRV